MSFTADTGKAGPDVRVPLSDPNFVSFWFVGGLTGVIRWFQLLALGVYTFETTRSPLLVSVVPLLWMLPLAICGPLIGAIADKLNRRMLLAVSLAMITLVSGSLEGMGAFVGALLVAWAARPTNYFQLYLWGTVTYISLIFYLSILSYLVGGPYHSLVVASIVLTMTGIAGACFAAMQSTLTYLGASPEYRSRVLGVLTLCIGSGPIGFLNVGWMADLWGAPTALLVMSLEGLFVLLLLWLFATEEESGKDHCH